MKKIILLGLLIFFLSVDLSFAKSVNKEKVIKAAKTFLVVRYPTFDPNSVLTLTKKGRSALCVKEVLPLRVNKKLVGYIVDLEPTGFILFSGDDEMPPVKIYSDTGSYERLPEGLQRVLELELLEDNTTVTSTSKKNQHVLLKIKRFSGQWNYLTSDEIQNTQNNNVEFYLTGAPGTAILTTTWHQNDPYNFYAPTASGGPGDRAWAGCTATALAQVLRHHRLPALVASNHTYVDNAGACQGTHSINDAGMGEYDWPNMPSSISISSPEAEKQAVGQLIYHCGVTLESNYEASKTSAFPSSVPSVLRTFFNYTCGNYLAKSNYTNTQWYTKIETDIDNDRPAFYAMWEADGSDGHAVVCDGYRNGNEIHLDMGWSGAWTAWYNIDSVAANGYTWTIHGAVFDITPPTNSEPILSNPRVNPISGIEYETEFEFMIDYYDADGDVPDYKNIYLSDGRIVPMTFKEGSSQSDGIYHYTTDWLSADDSPYSYYFLFTDGNGGLDMTPWQSGPWVHTPGCGVELKVEVSGGPVTNNIEICFGHGPDLGNLQTTCWQAPQLQQNKWISSGQQLMFSVNLESNNHTFTKWEFRDDNGDLVRESTASGYGFILLSGNIHATAYLSYTPINYTISGTVLREDSSPVPGGVDLTLNSSVQTLNQHTDDGNFSFAGVKGGVSVSVTPSASAGGYAFSPPSLSYGNLKANHTGESITAYASDYSVPMTSFLTVPPTVGEESSVSFSWIGEDDVTPIANLLYQYKLDGVDIDWSDWVSDTSKSYDIKNGAYTFWVRAQDEAGNINQAPNSYEFVVNAAPKVTSAIRIDRSVWASRVTLEMPESPNHPNDIFVLLPEHSGISDAELVPVTIHQVDEATPCGASTYVAAELGITERITKASTGYLVSLPNSVPLGQTAQYDIIWGKIKYFGWQESVNVSLDFPNFSPGGDYYGSVTGYYLDENLRLWRWADKTRSRISTYGDEITWALMNTSDRNGPVIKEKVLRFLPGIPWDGSLGRIYKCREGKVFSTGPHICQAWIEEKSEKVWLGADYDFFYYRRYALQLFDETGATVNFFESGFQEDTWIERPHQVIHNRLFVTGRTYNDVESTRDLWFIVHDTGGNEIISRTVFESIPKASGDLDPAYVLPLGTNVVFLFEHGWDTPANDDRQQICYQIRDIDGNLVKDTAVLNPPLLPDSVEQDDEYDFESVLTDNNGKVWICFEHTQPGPDEYYYSIIGTDGNVLKGPTLLSAERGFQFCDKDGYIWATESGQFLVLNDDDTTVVAPRANAYIPNQHIGNIAASVAQDGYRLYDRWSPQTIGIDVPSGVNPQSMELFDLNLWDNELHTADPNLMKGDTPVWNHPGQFTGHTTIDVSGILDEGQNLLTMTQNDFLGGQILVTFPYIICVDGDINCDGKVNYEDLEVLVNQWLQPPSTPSADIAPSPVDGFVNFLDFAVLAGDWQKVIP